jgi:catechol 2,3-dioxygenase-like lactoylglutathione lyase family enzyme
MSEAGPLFTRIDAVVLRVRDLAAARAWYTATLGLTATYEDPALKLAVLDMAGGTSLTLWERGPGEGAASGGGGFPILGVDDAEAAHRRLTGLGVETGPMQEAAGARFFSFRDPDGNRLDVAQGVAWNA